MGELEKIINLGSVSAKELEAVGINTYEKLKSVGSKNAWLKIKEEVNKDACLSKLSALEGAIRGIRWHDLPNDIKEDLSSFYNKNK